MKRFLLAALVLFTFLAALALGVAPNKPFQLQIAAANAGPQMVLCAPARESNSSTRQVSIPNLSQSYSADTQSCVIVSGLGDIAIFQAAGYSQPGAVRSIVMTTGVATGTTSFLVGTLPPGSYIEQILYTNVTANPAGNISFGTTSGGADVVAAQACGANCLSRVSDVQTLKVAFSTSSPQPIFISSSAWGSASLNVTLVYGFF
jgi:hypothetical protein